MNINCTLYIYANSNSIVLDERVSDTSQPAFWKAKNYDQVVTKPWCTILKNKLAHISTANNTRAARSRENVAVAIKI